MGLNIVIIGLSITSSWGNGHATTFRGLVKELHQLGHRVSFLERDCPWYANNRDLEAAPYCTILLYHNIQDLFDYHKDLVVQADLVMIGSFVPEGIEISRWVLDSARGKVAFYDIDTPVTLKKLEQLECEYLTPHLISLFDFYFSFTGGPILEFINRNFGRKNTFPLYCSVDPDHYCLSKENFILPRNVRWDLGHLGTYAPDRMSGLQSHLVDVAKELPERSFVVAGPQYPQNFPWPGNVEYKVHLPPAEHPRFYHSQRFTLNLTRQDMKERGYSPSVRLFEAALSGTPIISDDWVGMEDFFLPGKEILISRQTQDVLEILTHVTDEDRERIILAARNRVLAEHTPKHRALSLLTYIGY